MTKLPQGLIDFFNNQGFVIISTVDKDGTPHNSCKGIVKIDPSGRFYLLDLYRGRTYQNLSQNPRVSITAVDEHNFKGYSLKGKAKIVPNNRLRSRIMAEWERRITGRIAQRIIKNIHEEKGHPRHPEAFLPKPEYMIVVEAAEVVNLTPQHIR